MTTTSDWLYNNEPFLEPGENYGFVYIITNNTNGRKYIGKKFFWTSKRKQVNKVRKRYKVESDHHAMSFFQIHGIKLDIQINKSGISRATP